MNSREICQKFANDHKLIFEDEGVCGFGRECVGFITRRDHWLDHNPTDSKNYEPIKKYECKEVMPPDNINYYHKHDCMTVLGHGEVAINELAEWVNKINKVGNVRIVEYETKAEGLQAVFDGLVGYTIMAGT